MPDAVDTSQPSARRTELLAATRRYLAENSLSDLSLRPLAESIGSSPRVLLYLFGSKEGLIRAVLAAGREEQLALLARCEQEPGTPRETLDRLWDWLTAPERRSVLRLFFEGYVRALGPGPDGPWRGFATASLDEWLPPLRTLMADSPVDPALALAVIRGLLLDLLADDRNAPRVAAAWRSFLAGV
ncbi:TetR/AcrR family transcriptional regulator [Kitasatospora sp. NPDC087314]|uniref:TetR/AcrR family transcriptional regulator n=1 Tax=Kitasatospora sp. NPDC087314 TaxID=3364068 RepID=UPI0038208EDF